MIPVGLFALGAAMIYNHSLEEDDKKRHMEECANCIHFRGFGRTCKEGWTTPRSSTCWDAEERDYDDVEDWDD